MKISYNWLKQYVAVDISAERAATILTDTGLEVEGIQKVEAVKGGLEGVFIGEVLTCEQHPNADRLKVTTVSTGVESLQIVCGAPNVAAGQKVVVATVGSTLYPNPEEPFKIKKSKIRGVESYGMLCAEDELGLGKGHDGILVLDENVKTGTKASTYFDLEEDYQFEIGLTPNRADAMGHIGVARDLVAYLNVHENTNLELKLPSVSKFKIDSNDLKVEISVEDDTLCSRYMGTTIKGVSVKDSPAWLQKNLRAIGINPTNNVVDITNFVMHELGTPLHAFDAAELNGKLVVKTAKEGAKFETLDSVKRELSAINLMITNGSKDLCIAGILGGVDSGIKESTTDVFLESALFNPVSIRNSAKMHALNTDASFRFERGVDPNLTDYALKRAALLIQELAGGSIAMDVYDTNSNPVANKKVSFDYERCNRLIGANVDKKTVDAIFKNLDIHIVSQNGSSAELEIPAYRVDVVREADVVEEVLRIYGFNNVPVPEKLNSSMAHFKKPDLEKVRNVISELLVGIGCMETLNNSLTKSIYSKKFGGEAINSEQNVEMLHPLSQDLDVMRQSLIFNAMEMVAHNQNRQNSDLKLFEFGKTYHKLASGYIENGRLMITLSGSKHKQSWNSPKEQTSYYTIKGAALAVFQRLGLDGMLKEKAIQVSLLEDGVELYILKNKVGEIGWASNEMKKYFDIKKDVFVADLDWDEIVKCLSYSKIKFSELPKTFAVRRDFSLLLDATVNFSEIEDIAWSCDKKLLREVGLFDVYEGKKLAEGKKSYAVSFVFQDAKNTLKDKQVDAIMDKIRSELESRLNAQLR
jgi:phenylalanyl-tRNA synthetase beta chain